MMSILKPLTHLEREIIRLRYVHGLTKAKTARRLKMSIGRERSLEAKAIRKIEKVGFPSLASLPHHS